MAFSVLSGFACTVVSNAGPVPLAMADTAQGVIGAGGGTLFTPDGMLTLTVPRGAVDHDLVFTVGPTAAPLAGAVGAAFEIGPSGTQFATPATVTIRFASGDLGDGSASDLLVATVVAGLWQPLAAAAGAPSSMTVSGATPHLSPFALVHASDLVAPDAGADANDASSDGPPLDAGPRDDATGAETPADVSSDGLPEASSCTTEEMSTGACATPPQPLCSDLQGTVPASCIDSPVGAGFTAVCCPAADAGDSG